MKPLPEGGLLVRTFVPWAEKVELLRYESGEPVAELHRVHPEGLFEAEMESKWDVFSGAVERYAPILGERGMKAYRALAEAE